jgi:hypothetical protein
VTIVLKDGRTAYRFIAHAIGSIKFPMTGKQLEGKFADLADGVIPASAIRPFMCLLERRKPDQSRRNRENVRFGMTALGAPGGARQFDKGVAR